MKATYQITAPRAEIAIYYGWEYGIPKALELLKNVKKASCGSYIIKPLTVDCYGTKRSTDLLATRIRDVVISHKARMNRRLDNGVSVYVNRIKEN